MKERPILFSASMVRAILDGRKTQTRRVVKGFALELLQPDNFTPEYVALPENLLSPYGYAGDRLWVRESFWGCDAPGYGDQPCVVYDDEWCGKEYRPTEVRPWARKFGRIPSIHMPRDCSRITLEVTGVRAERLQHCSDDDAWAEGCPDDATWPLDWYRALWDTINGAGSWDTNPWVWAVEFNRVKA